ncbi:primosomal protein N' [Oscillospiraceae bacterium OttesenSCG-928-F05]|nr:primosomal protein N' [Oscillospiraceae bacterium OttesenSCG-928-F05]
MQEPEIARVCLSTAVYTMDKPYDYRIPEDLRGAVLPGVRVIVPFGRGNRKVEGFVLGLDKNSRLKKLKPISAVLDSAPVLDDGMIRLAVRLRERCFCTFYDALHAMLPPGLWYKIETLYTFAPGVDGEAEILKAEGDTRRKILEAVAAGGRVSLKKIAAETGLPPEEEVEKLTSEGILAERQDAVRAIGDKHARRLSLAISEEEAAHYIAANKRKKAAAAVLSFLVDAGPAEEAEVSYFTGASKRSLALLVKDGLLETEPVEVFRRPEVAAIPEERPELTDAQRTALSGLEALLMAEEAKAALLFGVTGSGKTRVYLDLVEKALAAGLGALVLVPEIALTPQLTALFAARFGEATAVLHSALTMAQRTDEWKRIRKGDAQVVLGTRSAIFAPLEKPGLIILDEEQESSYKSDKLPRYHARDMAALRVAESKGLLLLGSATPSVESMFAAKDGRYALFTLDRRVGSRAMPCVILGDMREELRAGNSSTIGAVLRREIAKNLEAGEQSIILINRRGKNRQVVCGACGYSPECPDCSVPPVYHSANGRLMCHYCGKSVTMPACCPECGGGFKFIGAGTQQCEEDLAALFPGVKILRMDADTTMARRAHETLLETFRSENIPILLGTQMVAKGLDFPNVTLVGVAAADQSLYMEDYRAHERTFALITQVVGRSGRGEKPGRAVIQTYSPENDLLEAAAAQDYMRFYTGEIALRERMGYPPFRDLIAITLSGASEEGTGRVALEVRTMFAALLRENGEQAGILGPSPAPVFRTRGRCRYHIMLSCKNNRRMREILAHLIRSFRQNKLYQGYAVSVDACPQNL